jgi:zinc/manganese transport system substrate-binding protein
MRSTRPPKSLLGALAAIALTSLGCSSPEAVEPDEDVVQVVASTDVWGDIAATVGGAHVQVTSLITGANQDPHSFEASARSILDVSEADVVIENGGGYDDFMAQLLAYSEATPRVITAVDASPVVPTGNGAFNEHVWYDLPTAIEMADQLAEVLTAVDPPHASQFQRNAERFSDSVQSLVDRELDMRQRLEGVPVSITEPVPSHMLEAIGAVNKTPEAFSAAVEDGSEIAVEVLDQTLDLYRQGKVAALVYNQQTTGPLTEQVRQAAEDGEVPVVPMTETMPAGSDYISWMTDNLDRLETALSRS